MLFRSAEQVAAFGPALHVVGRDAAALEAAVRRAAEAGGGRASRTETSLEDAFVGFVAGGEAAPAGRDPAG